MSIAIMSPCIKTAERQQESLPYYISQEDWAVREERYWANNQNPTFCQEAVVNQAVIHQ